MYLDNAATTQPSAEVVAAIVEALQHNWGNPSSRHEKGQQASKLLDESRATVAEALGVSPREIIFTSGGTESNNLALHGAAWASGSGGIITTALEHASVTKSVRNLKRQGYPVSYINVIGGDFDFDTYCAALGKDTKLVTIMAVQNELGYCLPLPELIALRDSQASQALFHVDAVQAFGKLPFRPKELGIDLASISAHKIGGPKGVGALYVRKGLKLFTTAHGGGQERWLRSGTEAMPLIAGFAQAVRQTFPGLEAALSQARQQYDFLAGELKQHFPAVIINSRNDGSPYILSFSLPNTDNHQLLNQLSQRGVYISTASACENNKFTVPEGTWRDKRPLTLQAAGLSPEQGQSTYRISLSPRTTISDLKTFIRELVDIIKA